MVRANNRPLEKRPDVLNVVCMNIAPYPFLSTMINSLMFGIFIGYASIGRPGNLIEWSNQNSIMIEFGDLYGA
jgi:hypothetical protein